MCGIAGIVAAPGGALPDEAIARAMTDAITHRGPDDDGIYRDDQAMLGVRRLSIIDLAGGHQPMHNEDGSVLAVFQRRDLQLPRAARASSRRADTVLAPRSDTEVIVHAYEEWGDDAFAHLAGCSRIALWDRRSRALLLARDRFGEKPLFYSLQGGEASVGRRLLFASELKSLLVVPGFRREIDPAAVRAYLCFGYVPMPGSIFREVHKLPPGHSLRFVDGRLDLRRYYHLELEPKLEVDELEAEEQLASLLDEAVKSRLVSDVPFGAFLSGGLDSSVVVALMARHLQTPVQTFSLGFRESHYNELADARRVASHLETEHHELIVKPNAVELLEQLVWHLDEPFADSSAVPTYLVAKLARRQVKMVLTGDGGDEAFAGYGRYLRFLALERAGPLRPAAAAAAKLAGRCVPGSRGYRLQRIAERLRLEFPESYLSGVALTRADVTERILGDAIRPDADGAEHYGGLAEVARAFSSLHPLDRCVSIDFASYLPDDILVKLDRMTMANSLEGRAPFLSHRLVEFAVRLPDALRVRDGRGKHLLRRTAARWLPPEVLNKPKQGFAIPLGQWFRGPLAALAGDLFASRAFRDRGLLQPEAARRYLDGHLRGDADHGELLWSMVSLELWARRYLDTGSGPA